MNCSLWAASLRALSTALTELYTEDPPSGICSRSCSHIARVPCKLLMLLIGSSRLYSIHHRGLVPAPLTWWRKLWSRDRHLGPTVTSLGRALLVCWMSAACAGGRPSTALPFLPGSHPPLCWCDRTAGPQITPVVASTHQWHVGLSWHPRQRMLVWRLHRWSWCAMQSPCPCRQNRTPWSEGVEHRQSHTSVRTKSFGDLVSSDEPEALPSSKGNPQFRDVEAIGWCCSLDYHICINCAYWHFAVPLLYGIQ